MVRRYHQVDIETGEVIPDGYVAVLTPKRINGFAGEGWFAMSQGVALDALMKLRRAEDFRVLMALLKRLDYDNLIQTSQSDVARELGIQRSQVNRAIHRLLEVGVIVEGPRIGIACSYRLNPRFGWKGSSKSHREAINKHLKVVIGGKR